MSTLIDATSTAAGSSGAGFGRFFLPGPTEVREDVLRAMLQPMIGHRGKGIEEIMGRIAPRLQKVFRTSRAVYSVTSSATGLMEGGVRNAVRERVLCLVNGSFSERFYKAAKNSGIPCDKLEVPYGAYHSPEMLADSLKGGKYDAITMVHSETSTGVLNPIGDLARVAHESGDVVVIVDTVSSMAGAQVECDAWELDYVCTGSQKALAVPPGLAFCTANERIFERARASSRRGLYFDVLELDDYYRKHQTPNTPAVSLLYALDVQLQHIDAEGIEARWARHQAMADRTYAWVAELKDAGLPLSLFAPEGYRSPTVTCIGMPAGKLGSSVTAEMKKRGFVIGSGYGKLKDDMVRIGHMGDHTVDELNALLDALREVLSA
ncbi:MAG: Serine-pyruvate aminotransferase [Gemmatimonadaceae bacterium]|nr:Serine-pyruvate aminotransferase [Gemmatimonadaceae bacterium]